MTRACALLFTLVLVAASPAAAQYYPPPPPPPPEAPPSPPPGPPPRYYPPPPPRYVPRYTLPEPAPSNTARVQVGFAFVNDAYDCWYAGVGSLGCGYGYGAAWPNVNAEVDLGLSQLVGLTVGGNVFWGDWNDVHNTVWEPHVDLLLRSHPYSDVRGRVRLGLGVLLAQASQSGVPGASASDSGAAFRIGAGVSFFARQRFGIGLDAVFEAGSIGGFYVSTLQLLLGPELHF